MKHYPVLTFYALAFLLSAVLLGLLLLLDLGELFFIATFGPGLAGLIAARVIDGKEGLRDLLRRIVCWRVGVRWWVMALLLPAVLALGSVLVASLFGAPSLEWSSLGPIYMVIASIAVLTLLNGITEETGWRGYALPRLQEKYSALVASLLLGFLWGLWHTPIFFLPETIQGVLGAQIGLVPGVALFTFLSMCSSVLYTWIFNHTQGSVLIAGLFHGAVNAWLGYFIVDMAYASQIIGAMTMVTLVAALLLAVALGPRLGRRSLTVSS